MVPPLEILKRIVIYVAGGKFPVNLWNIKSFESQAYHGTRGIAIERLIDVYAWRVLLSHFAVFFVPSVEWFSSTLKATFFLEGAALNLILSNRILFYLLQKCIIFR